MKKTIITAAASVIVAVLGTLGATGAITNNQTQMVVVTGSGQQVEMNRDEFEQTYNELVNSYKEIAVENDRLKQENAGLAEEKDTLTEENGALRKQVDELQESLAVPAMAQAEPPAEGEAPTAETPDGEAPAPAGGVLLGGELAPYTSTGYQLYSVSAGESFSMGGHAYSTGFTLLRDYVKKGFAHFNLEGKYTTLTGLIGELDGSNTDNVVTFIDAGNDKLLATYNLPAAALPTEIAVDVTGVENLKIDFSDGRNYVGFHNMTVQ